MARGRVPAPAMSGAVAVLAAGGSLACGGSPESHGADRRPVAEVRTARVLRGELPGGADVGGLVQARTTATLVARIMAPVLEVRVAPGDAVRSGQLLVGLDDRDLSAGARQARSASGAAQEAVRAAIAERDAARATRTLAHASHDRIAGLFARKSATAQEMDEAVAGLQAADARLASGEARVAQAEAALASARAAGEAATTTASFARITAPFSGVVTEKFIEPGNMAAPGTPLLRLEDTSSFRLEVRLDESRARAVLPGQRVPVSFDTLSPGDAGHDVTGTVSEVARAVDSGSRAVLVKIDLPAVEGLRSGVFGRARLTGPSRTALTAPVAAVVRRGQLTSMFVVSGDRAELRLVNLGPDAPGGSVEVLAGLDAGEWVVVGPPPGLTDGQRVRTTTRPAGEGDRR